MTLRLGFEHQRGPLPQSSPGKAWQVYALVFAFSLVAGTLCHGCAEAVAWAMTPGGERLR